MCLAIEGIADFFSLTVLAKAIAYFSFLLNLMVCSLMFSVNIDLVFGFFTHFAENLELSFSLLSCNVSRFNSFSFSSYDCLLFVIRLTATFCTLSNSLLFFCVMAELQTTLDCSRTLLMYVL